jgi:hypothetical protein
MPSAQGALTSAFAEASRGHLQHIYDLLRALDGKTSPADHVEEDLFRVREGFQDYQLEQAETQAPMMDYRGQASAGGMQLVHFARILQRTQLVGHFVSGGVEVPIHYGLEGAVILKRESRRFSVWGDAELKTSVLVPFEFVKDKSILEKFGGRDDFDLVDTGGSRPEYTQLRISAVTKAHERAVALRNRLYGAWHKAEGANQNDVLVIHGHVVDLPNAELSKNCLSLDMHVYLPWQNSQILEQMLQIPAGRRGPVLKVSRTSGDPMSKYMWFVRLRTSSKADPEFGLLCCTIIARDDEDARARADEVSKLVIAERLPVSFPAEGWDKLIFPLKLCRDYLDSLLPSRETVKSFFART